MTLIFISYRRSDSAADAGRLHQALRAKLADSVIFLDTGSIEPGAVWPDRLTKALADASVTLVIIGPDWIRAADEWGERLIDRESDWARREVETALGAGTPVIPLLVRDARMPPADKLPKSIAALSNRQAVEIRNTYFEHDVELVIAQIEAITRPDRGPSGSRLYPIPPPELPDRLSDEKVQIALAGTLNGWQYVESPLPEDSAVRRIELHREYHFRTFRDAISFMDEVAPGCDIQNHHPRWENIWRTVRVWLTTWDIGHRISDRDVQLAKYFDTAYAAFPGARPAE